ncbi:IS5 family transposase [Streptomyces shaanxiensis]|uniref:IS5 family transposase n=1 Tax=Streptomyces shaanxiensis TaxID=653357 RepID=A0ABP7WLM6_9ACTN
MRDRCYPTDMTDAEWELIEPLLPPPACTQPSGGRPEKYDRRTVIDAIRYLVDNGIKWRAVPTDFGIPWRSLYAYFQRWAAAGVVAHIRDQLHQQVRVRESKNPRTVTVILDAQSVKGAETVGAATRGYDAGKKINGRKRHLAVDTRGLPMFVMVTTAGINDGPLGRDMLLRLRLAHPEVTLAWAASAYLPLVDWANTFLGLTLQTVSRPRGQKGFVVLPKRWVVERAISWIMRGPPERQGLRAPSPTQRGTHLVDPDHLDDTAVDQTSQKAGHRPTHSHISGTPTRTDPCQLRRDSAGPGAVALSEPYA